MIRELYEAVTGYIDGMAPRYALATADPNGLARSYATSSLETLGLDAVFMGKGKNHGVKNHSSRKHTPSKTITVHAHGREEHIDRNAHQGTGKSLAQYIADSLNIGIKQARRAIKNCSRTSGK
jgi:hypothetical protein